MMTVTIVAHADEDDDEHDDDVEERNGEDDEDDDENDDEDGDENFSGPPGASAPSCLSHSRASLARRRAWLPLAGRSA